MLGDHFANNKTYIWWNQANISLLKCHEVWWVSNSKHACMQYRHCTLNRYLLQNCCQKYIQHLHNVPTHVRSSPSACPSSDTPVMECCRQPRSSSVCPRAWVSGARAASTRPRKAVKVVAAVKIGCLRARASESSNFIHPRKTNARWLQKDKQTSSKSSQRAKRSARCMLWSPAACKESKWNSTSSIRSAYTTVRTQYTLLHTEFTAYALHSRCRIGSATSTSGRLIARTPSLPSWSKNLNWRTLRVNCRSTTCQHRNSPLRRLSIVMAAFSSTASLSEIP